MRPAWELPLRCVGIGDRTRGDCTIFFRWGAFDYVIGGFTGLWSKPTDASDSEYQDLVRQGLDFYDGSNVPSVTEIRDGRVLMAAWVPIRGWGGNLIIRELIQYPDGRIGSKWMDEITPETGKSTTLAAAVADTATFAIDHSSFMLTFRVQPVQTRSGKIGLVFLPEDGEQAARQLRIGLDDLRAQFGPGSLTSVAGKEKSLREGGAPHGADNYAIENLIDVDRPFAVRVIVKSDDKIGGSLIDVEIAGQRTMISYRRDLNVRKIVFSAEGADLTAVRIAPFGAQDRLGNPESKDLEDTP